MTMKKKKFQRRASSKTVKMDQRSGIAPVAEGNEQERKDAKAGAAQKQDGANPEAVTGTDVIKTSGLLQVLQDRESNDNLEQYNEEVALECERAGISDAAKEAFQKTLPAIGAINDKLIGPALQMYSGTYDQKCQAWPTGTKVLDNLVRGIGQGITVVLADTACFKTFIALVTALFNAMCGRRVIYIDCENGPWRLTKRILALMGIVTSDAIHANPDVIKSDAALSTRFLKLFQQLSGKFRLLDSNDLGRLRSEYDANEFCKAVFNMTLKELRHCNDEILLVIDSGNKMPSAYREAKARLEHLLSVLEIITMLPHVRVLLICELKKGASKRSKVDLCDTKDSVEVAYACSKALALVREDPEDEGGDMEPVEVTVSTLKNRDGILNESVAIHFDPKQERFTEGPDFSAWLE